MPWNSPAGRAWDPRGKKGLGRFGRPPLRSCGSEEPLTLGRERDATKDMDDGRREVRSLLFYVVGTIGMAFMAPADTVDRRAVSLLMAAPSNFVDREPMVR